MFVCLCWCVSGFVSVCVCMVHFVSGFVHVLGLFVCICIGVCSYVYICVGTCVSGALCVCVSILEPTLQSPHEDLSNVHLSYCLHQFVSGGVYSHGISSAKSSYLYEFSVYLDLHGFTRYPVL